MKVIGTAKEIEWLKEAIQNSCDQCPYMESCSESAKQDDRLYGKVQHSIIAIASVYIIPLLFLQILASMDGDSHGTLIAYDPVSRNQSHNSNKEQYHFQHQKQPEFFILPDFRLFPHAS